MNQIAIGAPGGAAGAGGAMGIVVYNQTWYSNVLGLPLSTELRIALSGGQFVFQITVRVAGKTVSIAVPVGGNQSIPIPLPYVGNLVVDIGGWSLSSTQLIFDLSIRLSPPFIPAITITTQHVIVPIPAAAEGAAGAGPQSAAEFLATLQLLGTSSSQQGGSTGAAQGGSSAPGGDPLPNPSDYTPEGIMIPYSGGGFGLSQTFFSKDYAQVALNRLPAGYTRSHVVVNKRDPKNGGWCAFVAWDSEDPNVADFSIHIGCPAWQGGTADCHVYVNT